MQLIFLLLLSLAVRAEEDISLDKKLNGLDPEPRLTYLRYLIDTEGGSSEIFFHMGVAFHETEQSDSAIYYYRKAVEQDSLMFKAFVNMGILYDNDDNMIKAVENYEAALEIRPDDALANTHLASLYYRRKVYDMAIMYLRRALRSNPSHPQPHYYLGNFFADCGIYREALTEWRKVMDLDPGSYLASRARRNIGTLAEAMDRPSMPEFPGTEK